VSEQVEEQEAGNGGDGAPEVELPEGWELVHHRPEELVELSGTQARFQINPAQLRAEKQINGSLVNAQGSTPEELSAAVQAVETSVQAFLADYLGNLGYACAGEVVDHRNAPPGSDAIQRSTRRG